MGGRNSGRTSRPQLAEELDEGVDPWERQPRETDQAWAAFKAYRDLGLDRSIAKAVESLGKKPNYRTTCEAWSQRWAWRLRTHAWDMANDAEERKEALAKAQKVAAQKAGFADAMWMTGMRGLSLWNEYLVQFAESQKERRDAGEPLIAPPITPTEIQRLAETGVKLGLLLEGKPTEIEERRLSVEDRRREVQKLIGDKKVRGAMRVVAKALGESGGKNASGGGRV